MSKSFTAQGFSVVMVAAVLNRDNDAAPTLAKPPAAREDSNRQPTGYERLICIENWSPYA